MADHEHSESGGPADETVPLSVESSRSVSPDTGLRSQESTSRKSKPRSGAAAAQDARPDASKMDSDLPPDHAMALLRDLEHRARASTPALPPLSDSANVWRGVAFSVGGQRLLIEMDEVKEVVNAPRVSRVPGTRSWLRGVTNVRGTLLSVVDLHGFLTGETASPSRTARVLVVSAQDEPTGLWVEEVHGLKHFLPEHAREPESLPAWLQAFVVRTYTQGGGTWHLLDVESLVCSPAFDQVVQ